MGDDPLSKIRCPDCGALYALVGRRHNCNPRKPGRPKIEDRDKTIEATEPWKAAGMSRASWYRRRGRGKK